METTTTTKSFLDRVETAFAQNGFVLSSGTLNIFIEFQNDCEISGDRVALGMEWEGCFERLIRSIELSNPEVRTERLQLFADAGVDGDGTDCTTQFYEGPDQSRLSAVISMLESLFVE